jgi:deoxyribodipyrimidine photo-lyase
MTANPCIVWLRQDLRLGDNPALLAAAETKRPLILLYIADDAGSDSWRMGGASRWWLHHTLDALAKQAAKRKCALTLRRGETASVLSKLIADTGATSVYWNRCYEPHAVARDTAIQQNLTSAGVEVITSNGALLFEPWTVKTKAGEPFKVFTPFWRACLQMEWRAPQRAPKTLNAFDSDVPSDPLASWALLPTKPNWAKGFEPLWTPGEAGALRALDQFIDEPLRAYPERRDQLSLRGTSRLSAHLHFGEISPSQVRARIEHAAANRPELRRGADKFLAEIGWREFSTNLLFHWPSLPAENWRAPFNAFPWRDDAGALAAWKHGRTGYPVVDAAMRELWTTGYMHNRARMIAASFLIKHLLIDWQRGEEWFWDTLLDADLANNAASWQWVAGCGADASPYFRIFNPVLQGERYDSNGAYVRRWLPELAKLPNDVIHKPWTADAAILKSAGVNLGVTYPKPIVDHDKARARALAAYASLS